MKAQGTIPTPPGMENGRPRACVRGKVSPEPSWGGRTEARGHGREEGRLSKEEHAAHSWAGCGEHTALWGWGSGSTREGEGSSSARWAAGNQRGGQASRLKSIRHPRCPTRHLTSVLESHPDFPRPFAFSPTFQCGCPSSRTLSPSLSDLATPAPSSPVCSLPLHDPHNEHKS